MYTNSLSIKLEIVNFFIKKCYKNVKIIYISNKTNQLYNYFFI